VDGALDVVHPLRRECAKLLNEKIAPDRDDAVKVGRTRTYETVLLIEVDFRVEPSDLRRDLSDSYLSAEIKGRVPRQ